MFHRLAGFNQCSEVEDAIEGSVFIRSSAKDPLDLLAIGDVGLDKLDARGNFGAPGVAQVVYDDDLVSATL
jgi:hypothetical protein